jgi:hypothetical protein
MIDNNDNATNITNKTNQLFKKMTKDKNDNNNILYKNKISKLETEINELKYDKEKMRENLSLFFTLIKKYSHKLSSLTNNFNNNNSFISPSNYKELKSILLNLNKAINNPKLNEEILEFQNNNNIYDTGNININNNIDNTNNINNTNNNNNTSLLTNNDKIDKLEEYKNNVEEIISKYEKKIDILNKENEDYINKINILKNENILLKEQLDEEIKIKENIMNKLNKLKENNNELEKKNKILDYKCTSYFNRSTQSKYEQKNIEEEIEYKNKIINYLVNLIKNTGIKRNEEIYKRNINKVIDLKKNLKEVINGKKIKNDDINKNDLNMLNLLSNEKSKLIENGSSFINEKTISSNSFKSNNKKQIKKEIDDLDEEIAQIQSKLESMIKDV